MILYGTFKMGTSSYLCYLKDMKKTMKFCILRQGVLNENSANPDIALQETIDDLNGVRITPDKVLAGFIINKSSRETHHIGSIYYVEKLVSTFEVISSYAFYAGDIRKDETEGIGNRSFSARDSKCLLQFDTEDGLYKSLSIIYNGCNLRLRAYETIKALDKVTNADFTETSLEFKQMMNATNLSVVTMADLYAMLDMSWYENKRYRVIETIDDFEEFVMAPLNQAYAKAKATGEPMLLSLDTETTGLNIYNLSDDNIIKSHLVATPISWEDNSGVVVFNRMKKFNNVPADYMFDRLRPFLEKDSELDRSLINLVGHNVMFDGRVLYDNGVKPYWNNDTMQMSFNLDPKVAKGKYTNKLKGITRRLFGHETPELSDILGKGNEDKYGYLTDKEVAMVYGCADADYTRLVYKALRKLMPDHLYNVYQQQDMPMLNQLYISEYNGLRIDEEKVIELANIIENDLDKIHEFLKGYVGRFINISNQMYLLHSQLDRGEIDQETFNELVQNIKVDRYTKYEFEMKARDYRDLMFKKFNYPVIAKTDTGELKTDKFVLKKLSSVKLETPSNVMTEDLVSESGEVLISAKTFNSLKYPLAYVILEYKKLEKEFTAYYKPIRDNNSEGRLFKNYSMSRIETFRIMNPSQTIKANLKALVKPYDDDYYLVDFDMAQVEYRIMVSIAKQMNMVERLRDPEKDFHTESAAAIMGKEPHLIDKKTRKQFKAINFGIPYGLSDFSLSEKLYGSTKERDLVQTRILKGKFEQANENVINFLEHQRDLALQPVDLPIEFKRFCGYIKDEVQPDLSVKEVEIPVGMVKNALGRYRLFRLDDLDNRKIGTIRRAAGNFPIQSFAAELFRIILINFANRCEKEGIADKIKWNMLIHDELLFSAHKSINPYYLYKIIEEECMVTFEGHTDYFVGINMGLSWAECKDDLIEAPVGFVRQQKKLWDEGKYHEPVWIDNPQDYIHEDMMNYFRNRIHEVLLEIQPNMDNESINFMVVLNQLKNYKVRNYVTDYFVPRNFILNGKPSKAWFDLGKDSELDLKFIFALAEWAVQFYGSDVKFVYPSGKEIKAASLLNSAKPDESATVFEDDEDLFEDDEDIEEAFYDSDTGEYVDTLTEYDVMLMNNHDYYDPEVKELKTSDLAKPELNHVEDTGSSVRVYIHRKDMNKVKSVLQPYVTSKGKPIVFVFKDFSKVTWLRVSKDIDLYKIDKEIGEVI